MKNKYIKTFIYTFIFVMSISFATFPSSYTKFNEMKTEVLKYSSEIVALNKTEDDSLQVIGYNDDYTLATVKLVLERNSSNYLDGVEKDIYLLELPDGCTTDNSELEFIDEDMKEIFLTCDLTNKNIVKDEIDGKKNLVLNVEVNQQINDDSMAFRFKEYKLDEEINLPSVKEVEENVNQIDNKKLEFFQKKITEIILAKDKYKNYQEEITNYIKSADLSNNNFELAGIVVSYQEETDEFFYQIDENFLGYARTYFVNLNNVEKNTMIFSSEDSISLEKAFEYYLDEYFAENNDNCLLLNYMKLNNGISSVILDNNNILGVTRINNDTIKINDDIMNYVSELNKGNKIYLANGNVFQTETMFNALIDNNADFSITLKENIKVKTDLYNKLNEEYNMLGNERDYFLIKDNNEFNLFEVIVYENYKQINYSKINVDENANNLLIKINFAIDNKPANDNYQKIIEIMEEEFNATYIVDTVNESSENNNIVVSFELEKRLSSIQTSREINSNNILDVVESANGDGIDYNILEAKEENVVEDEQVIDNGLEECNNS